MPRPKTTATKTPPKTATAKPATTRKPRAKPATTTESPAVVVPSAEALADIFGQRLEVALTQERQALRMFVAESIAAAMKQQPPQQQDNPSIVTLLMQQNHDLTMEMMRQRESESSSPVEDMSKLMTVLAESTPHPGWEAAKPLINKSAELIELAVLVLGQKK